MGSRLARLHFNLPIPTYRTLCCLACPFAVETARFQVCEDPVGVAFLKIDEQLLGSLDDDRGGVGPGGEEKEVQSGRGMI